MGLFSSGDRDAHLGSREKTCADLENKGSKATRESYVRGRAVQAKVRAQVNDAIKNKGKK